MKTIGERIRQARDGRKMTGEQLAEKVGYKKQSAIANLENRASGTGGNKINAIADALSVSVEWLMRGPDGPNVPYLPGMNIGEGDLNTTHEVRQEVGSTVLRITTGHDRDAAYDTWTCEAINIMLGLQEHDRRGAVANLKTYVHNLGPPLEQFRPANNEKTGT